jgi:hypothetical protein
MSDETVVPAAPPEPQAASRWEDYIDVFIAPSDLFARRARDRVLPPLLTLMGLAVLFYFVMMPANAMFMRASVADNPDAIEAMNRFGLVMQLAGAIMVPITYLAIAAFAAALLWTFGRIADIRIDFSRAMLIATYTAFVYLIAQIAGGVAVLVHGEAGLDIIRHTSFGPLRFVGDTDMNRVFMALLRRLDIFAIWQAVLWAIGLHIIYNVSRMHAGIVAAAVWLAYALPGVLAGALGLGGTPGQG